MRLKKNRTMKWVKVTMRMLAHLEREASEDFERPKTRGDCRHKQRPCGFLLCKHHLLTQHRAGHHRVINGKRVYVDASYWVEKSILGLIEDRSGWRRETCALDVADRGPHTLEQVADHLGVTRERVRQIECDALKKMREAFAEDEECVG